MQYTKINISLLAAVRNLIEALISIENLLTGAFQLDNKLAKIHKSHIVFGLKK
jgi:hypothetical protein